MSAASAQALGTAKAQALLYETAVFRRGANANASINASICGCNHLSSGQSDRTLGNLRFIFYIILRKFFFIFL